MPEIVSSVTPKHLAVLGPVIADLVLRATKRFRTLEAMAQRKRNANRVLWDDTNRTLPVVRVCHATSEDINRWVVFRIVCHVYQANTKTYVGSRRAKNVGPTPNRIRPPPRNAWVAVLANFPPAVVPNALLVWPAKPAQCATIALEASIVLGQMVKLLFVVTVPKVFCKV